MKKLLVSWFSSLMEFIVGLENFFRSCWNIAKYAIAVYGKLGAFGEVMKGQTGAITASNAVEVIILIMVAIMVLYQVIQQIGGANATVQASANVSTMGKWAAGLGEWLLPLLAVVALVMLLIRRGKGKGGV